MCLFKSLVLHPHNRPLIADRDIICYKKVKQVGKNAYITPCTNAPIPIECIQNKVPFEAQILSKFKFIWRHVFGFGRFVEDGFIHTYQEDNGWRICEVFECIIPKGTKYFVGVQGDYASEKIIFLKQMDIE